MQMALMCTMREAFPSIYIVTVFRVSKIRGIGTYGSIGTYEGVGTYTPKGTFSAVGTFFFVGTFT